MSYMKHRFENIAHAYVTVPGGVARAEIVFSNTRMLAELSRALNEAVREAFEKWECAGHPSPKDTLDCH